MPVPLHNSIVHSMVSYLYILVPLKPFHIHFAIFFLIQAAIIQFSVIIKVRSQPAVPVPVVRQWLDRHQTGVKKSSGSGQAIIRQWLGNQLGSQCTIVDQIFGQK